MTHSALRGSPRYAPRVRLIQPDRQRSTPDTTADLPYNATAQEVQDAINAILLADDRPWCCDRGTAGRSYIVTFDNETTASYAQPTEITIYDEQPVPRILPVFTRSRFNNKWNTTSAVQAPVATSTLTTKLPDAPYITERSLALRLASAGLSFQRCRSSTFLETFALDTSRLQQYPHHYADSRRRDRSDRGGTPAPR